MNNYEEKLKNKQETSGKDFKEYFSPSNIQDAVELLSEYGSDIRIIAGGTDILVEYFDKLYEIERWLDLKNIEQMKKIEVKNDVIEVGSLVTHAQIEKSDTIREYLPVLNAAAWDVGSPQIRNRGTIGGNICTSSPAGDLLAPLIAYDAIFRLVSKNNTRDITAEDFFVGPKRNVLQNDEILYKIIIPIPKKNSYGKWIKVGKRKALIISSITLAFVISFDNENRIEKVRCCLGSVAPTPISIKQIEKIMLNKKLSDIEYENIGRMVSENISPIDDIRGTKEYRREVAKRITINALEEIERMVRVG
ncbi:FAD binding domain-containing protein [Petrotoga halophila]|uniref:FAD-binding molybdopterin dehydrogenase n=1 Tax=Petrotoga halophila DSM 16923 TaxID=1122953 RepID=A0A2S5EDJ8_9BACT|nr:xanthine dehydrogenase family protein subunit M [Petrotoga halophila]POZ91233.1 FAD-binding molybdopterin dehydrogenase [Petrotoga halophila DSM 16923]